MFLTSSSLSSHLTQVLSLNLINNMKQRKDTFLFRIKKLASIPQAFLVVLNSPINKEELHQERNEIKGFYFGDLAKI